MGKGSWREDPKPMDVENRSGHSAGAGLESRVQSAAPQGGGDLPCEEVRCRRWQPPGSIDVVLDGMDRLQKIEPRRPLDEFAWLRVSVEESLGIKLNH